MLTATALGAHFPATAAEKSIQKFGAGLPVSVSTLAGQTPEKAAELLGRRLDKGILTTSGRVLITSYSFEGFDIQLDHDLQEKKKCIYIGVSFSAKPVIEAKAWDIVHFKSPPRRKPGRNTAWELEPGVAPFKRVQRILQPGTNKVGKLAFSTITVQESMKIYGN
jgi:hypothetical protein